MLDSSFVNVHKRTFPTTGAGPLTNLNRAIDSPAYSPGKGSYSRAGLVAVLFSGQPDVADWPDEICRG